MLMQTGNIIGDGSETECASTRGTASFVVGRERSGVYYKLVKRGTTINTDLFRIHVDKSFAIMRYRGKKPCTSVYERNSVRYTMMLDGNGGNGDITETECVRPGSPQSPTRGPRPRNYGSMAAARAKDNQRSSEASPEEKWRPVKPDGGWGWLVVLGAAVNNMTTQSIISVFGLLFMRRLPELGIDTSGVSLVVSFQITILNLSGLVTGPILKKLSPRQVACTGAAFVMAGLFLTGFANSLPAFLCTYSALTGLGIGFLYPSTFVAINSYFTTWRGRAVGLTATGTGIGQMLLPLLVRYLLDEYGFNGTVMILSGLSSHAFVGASLFQPVEWHMKRRRVTEEEEEEEESLKTDGESREEEVKNLVCDNVAKKPSARKRLTRLSRILGMMDWDLLKDPSFLSVIVCLGLVYTANIMFQMLLPFFLQSVGYARKDIAICMSVLSGADIIGRLAVPSITDIFKLRTKTVFFAAAGLSALARSGLVWYNKSYGHIYLTLGIAAVCGIVRAGIICNFNLCVSDETTPEKLPSALGLHMVFKGLSVLLFGPLIGFIRDYTESYSLSMHALNIFFLLIPFLVWLMEYVALKRGRR